MWLLIGTALASAALGVGLTQWHQNKRGAAFRAETDKETEEALKALQADRARAFAEAVDQREKLKAALQEDLESFEEQVAADEGHAEILEQACERRAAHIAGREEDISARFDQLKARRSELGALKASILENRAARSSETESRAGATHAEIAERCRENLKDSARLESARLAQKVEETAKLYAETEARKLIDLALQRCSTNLDVARLQATVDLPQTPKVRAQLLENERALLSALGEPIQVTFNESGEDSLYIEAPDTFQREIGRLAYERFLKGGIFTEVAARKIAEKTEKDLHTMAHDAGKRAGRILKLKDVHPELLYLVGKLLYRTSYTQNQWQHVVEVAQLAGLLASSLGLDPKMARRAGLLHDVGKALKAESDALGSHALAGAQIAREFGESEEIVHAIAAHHNDEPPRTALAHLIAAADALSGGRPGARRETVEAYTRRVEEIKAICDDFKEIKKSYVIQGGREVRLEVFPRQVSDEGTFDLAAQVAERISNEVTFPGQIKIIALREMRASATAK